MRRGFLLGFLLLIGLTSMAQVRAPAVAGAFYPEKPENLFNVLAELLPKREIEPRDAPQAIIVPHAGYAYSGEVAAQAYFQIPAGADFERIFIIGASHTKVYPGASIFVMGNYKTPFGEVEVDTAVGKKLINESPYFAFPAQRPYQRTQFGSSTSIIAISIGSVV